MSKLADTIYDNTLSLYYQVINKQVHLQINNCPKIWTKKRRKQIMKFKFYPNQHYTTNGGWWTYTWFLSIATKNEDFWLVSYEVMSLVIGFIFSFVLVIASNNKELVKILCGLISDESIQTFIVILYLLWLISSAWELYLYCDVDESREWKKFGKLQFVIKLAVRIVRGLPIIILGMGIIYGLFYLASLLIGLL